MEQCFEKIFSNGYRPKKTLKFFYAYDYIIAGLRYYCGNKAQWLPQYDEIVDWLHDNDGKGLLVMGSAGVGKSLICRDIIPAIINKDQSDKCGVISAYQLTSMSNEVFHRGFLMIDDIGVEEDYSQYGTKRNIVREKIDEFEMFKGILILTTNLTPSELTERYGERSVDRLRAICRFVVIEGDSFRKGINGDFPIPIRHRAYGIDFKTKEEADKFRKEQDALYDGYYKHLYGRNPEDADEISERQPVKLYNGVLFALLKYDWTKIK